MDLRQDEAGWMAVITIHSASTRVFNGLYLLLIRIETTGFDAALDPEAARRRLVVIVGKRAGFDTGFDLQAASRRLVVVKVKKPGFDVCFDFHIFLLLLFLVLTGCDNRFPLRQAEKRAGNQSRPENKISALMVSVFGRMPDG